MRERLTSFFHLSEKPWETSILGKQVYSLDVDSSLELQDELPSIFGTVLNEFLARAEMKTPCMIATRLEAKQIKSIRALERAEFRLIECYLEYDHDLTNLPPLIKDVRIDAIADADIPAVEQLAGESFLYSRFHMDEQIPREIANKTRSEWVRNACLGRAEAVFVSRDQQGINGFVICQKKAGDAPAGNLDLMAVSGSARQQGIGFALTSAFLDYCKKKGYMRAYVGTQAHNVSSNWLYQKAGFRLCRAFYSYHKHLE